MEQNLFESKTPFILLNQEESLLELKNSCLNNIFSISSDHIISFYGVYSDLSIIDFVKNIRNLKIPNELSDSDYADLVSYIEEISVEISTYPTLNIVILDIAKNDNNFITLHMIFLDNFNKYYSNIYSLSRFTNQIFVID